MLKWLLAFFSGCPHNRMTWPIGPRDNPAVTCLSCGVQFAYSWDSMSIGAVIPPAPYVKIAREPSPNVKVVEMGARRRKAK
jgi:hypothetical protein